ncbi:MAG: CRTAC1 family protein [Rhodobacteraceae bacterium]|nr:CRTAC1 family protein [Paracoccaceae bacterium]
MNVLRAAALCLLTAPPALSQPAFEDHSANIPTHSYAGGWEHFVGGGVAVFDCNGDGLPEILAAGGDNPMILLKNLGNFAFTRAAFEPITGATGAYPLDIDGDGWQDLYILRAGADRLLRGGPDCSFGAFSPALFPQPEERWSTAFTAWWEGDALPVLAIGHYVDRDAEDGPFGACDDNLILRPGPDDGRNTGPIGYTSELLSPGYCALSMMATTNAAGRQGLRISNDRHYYLRNGHEQMWDIEQRRFLGPDDGWPHISLWGMGIASRDLTGDGRDEVLLTSMGDQVMMVAQDDGSYAPAPFTIGTYAQRPFFGDDGRPSTGWHAQFGDINNDGLPDLFIAKGNVDQMPGNAIHDPNNMLVQLPDGTFTEHALTAGIATTERSRGAALADFDGDGRLDLVVINRRAPMELYRNVTPDAGNWLAVSLVQPDANRDAIGARVTVLAGDLTQVQERVIGGGHAGGQNLPLHFGLGAAAQVQITVAWPDGRVTTAMSPANRHVTLSR